MSETYRNKITTKEPRTEAGRKLLGKMTTPLADRYWRDWVLAIEDEARADLAARIEAIVMDPDNDTTYSATWGVRAEAILNAIRKVSL